MRRQCVPPRGASRGPRHQPTQIRRPATRGGEELQPQPEPPRRHRCPAAVAHLAAPPIIDRGGIYRPGLSLGHGGGGEVGGRGRVWKGREERWWELVTLPKLNK